MTIASTARKAGPLLGNGSATSFSFGFKVFATGDVKVAIADSAGVETVLVEGTHYTVSLNANQETSPGGSVTYPVSGSPLPVGSVLSIIGDLDYDQPLDLPSGGNFSPLALENQLDRATIQIQQLREEMDRTAKLPPTSSESVEKLVDDLQRIADSADNLDSVAGSLSAVNTVATSIADVNTVASNLTDVTNFSDVYYGPSASDPTLRKDGSALQSGDLYFYTGRKRLRVFDGTAWVDGPINAGTITLDTFSGTGAQTAFTLSVDPVSENNAQVFIGGVYRQKSEYSVSGTTLTFSAAPAAGTNNIEVLSTTTLALGTTDATLVGFKQSGTGAVARTVQDELRDLVSVKQFGVLGDGSDEFTKIKAAWDYCLANGKDLYFPSGIYSSGANNMPFKNPTFPATSLLDCKNITIYGDGPTTVLRTDSTNGADVLNVYSVKNLHFRNMKLKGSLPAGASGAGSNGISVVGGFDNVTFDYIWAEDLPYIDKSTYLDGGKAFSIQPGTPATECGTLKATNIFAKGCVYGAGLEIDLANWSTKKHAIEVDIVAEDCYAGVIVSAGEATGALPAGMTSGFKVRAQLVNCQQNVILGRAHGVEIDANIITTKTAAARRLNPAGGAWKANDTQVVGLIAQYAKNSRISVYGSVGECDYKARVGGASAGSSGQGGTTDNCLVYVDLGGTAATADFDAINAGGNVATNTILYVSATTTSAALPTAFYTASYNNTVTKGPAQRLVAPSVAGALGFTYTDGQTIYNTIERDGLGLFFKQIGSSSANTLVQGVKNHSGTQVFGVRNDGAIATGGRGGATAVATVKGILPVYTEANDLFGYVPVYTTYTA